jgi:hypothetical protein
LVLNGTQGDDTLTGGAGRDSINGMAGNDTLIGGLGTDTMTGGEGGDTFRDTAAGLNSDTITDFGVGDTIVNSDVNLASFTFSLSENMLAFSGGSLSFGATVSGTFIASSAAGGGVQLALQAAGNDVRNDFNGDGRSDVIWRSDTGAFTEWLGQPNGGFVFNHANAAVDVPMNWHVAGTGDFNGDGRDDVIWRSDSGAFTEWLGQPNGGFVFNHANAAVDVPMNWHVAGTGDFNGDGREDVIWRSDTGAFTEWLGQSNGGFVFNHANAYVDVSANWHVQPDSLLI